MLIHHVRSDRPATNRIIVIILASHIEGKIFEAKRELIVGTSTPFFKDGQNFLPVFGCGLQKLSGHLELILKLMDVEMARPFILENYSKKYFFKSILEITKIYKLFLLLIIPIKPF